MRFYLGGYSTDLVIADLDADDGSITVSGTVTTPENASFLLHVPELRTLYATVESGYKNGTTGKIAAYRVGEAGDLTAIGSIESAGAGPCHLDVDPRQQVLAVANYGGETFAVVALREDGTPDRLCSSVRHAGKSVNPKRQAEPHPHATNFSPDGRFLFVCDLGIDRVMRYPVDRLRDGGGAALGAMEARGVEAAVLPAGAGPRHLTFSSDGAFVYVFTELSNAIVVFAYDAERGALTEVQQLSSLPETFDGESTGAEIQLHPNGRFLYVSNRGHESLARFTRNPETGMIQPDGYVDVTGEHPRHFQIDASGSWCLVANQHTDHVVSFRVDARTGALSWSGCSLKVTAPSCCEFLRG